jgi:hypothetical protein
VDGTPVLPSAAPTERSALYAAARMSILIRTGGGWHRATRVSYEKESEFQALVKETFDLILATQTDATSVIAREVGYTARRDD